MDARTGIRRLVPVAGALALFAGNAASLRAQSPPPAQFPAGPIATTPIDIEVYYGVNKVSPASAVEIVPETASTSDGSRAAESFLETLKTFREGTATITTAAAGLLNKVAERTQAATDARAILFANYSTPLPETNAPWLASRHNATMLTAAPAPSESAAAPTIVVVREPSAEKQKEPSRGLFLSMESLIAFGVAAVAFAFGIWARARASKALAQEIIAPAQTLDPNAVQLMGQYNAGPLPDTAEKFEIGMTFHEEVQQKKQVEEQNNVAAVEFILNQNLALLAAMSPQAVVVDADGFALPEEPSGAEDDFELEVRGGMIAAA